MDHFNQSGNDAADGGLSSPSASGTAGRDLFALTDEQILEIQPEAQGDGGGDAAVTAAGTVPGSDQARPASGTAPATTAGTAAGAATSETGVAAGAETASGAAGEPPRWLAEVMADPQRGGEARDFWNGVAQARQDAAAYREVFAGPAEARAAADRARALDQIDRAYFAGNASDRSQLAATMLREDPAAFREMVFEGLRALEEAEKGGGAAQGAAGSRLARVFGGASAEAGQATVSGAPQGAAQNAVRQPGTAAKQGNTGETGVAGHHGNREQEARMAAYASFEKSANEDLERNVGAVINRTLEQALPNAGRTESAALKTRLVGAIRQDIEKALQGDRQLGEQVAQLLSGKRLNDETRAQVVRLIGARAEQLVPGAARRILNDWTQTTLAAHRERSGRGAAASSRQEVATVAVNAGSSAESRGKVERGREVGASRSGNGRGVDYRKLSDEQILAM